MKTIGRSLFRRQVQTLAAAACLAVFLSSCGAARPSSAPVSSAPPPSSAAPRPAASSGAGAVSSAAGGGSAERRTEPLTEAEAAADMNELIGYIKGAHPIYENPGSAACKKTDAAEAEFRKSVEAIDRTVSMDDFGAWCHEYLASIADLHTDIIGDRSFSDVWQDRRFIPTSTASWWWNGGRLYLLDENKRLSKRYVTEIGGVPVAKITETIGRLYDAENDVGTAYNNAYYSHFAAILARSGVRTDGPVTLTVEGPGGTEKMRSELKSPSPYAPGNSDVAGYYRKGDCFYLDMNQFDYSDALNQATGALNQAVYEGTRKVVWDLRGNPGGNADVADYIFTAMKMTPPHAGFRSRKSELMPQKAENPADLDAVPNPKVKLVVLIDEFSDSASTVTAARVQDGKLGIVMGRATRQAPDMYGGPVKRTLKNSSFMVQIATVSVTRPDRKANRKELVPDVVVPFGEDELQAAFDYLK